MPKRLSDHSIFRLAAWLSLSVIAGALSGASAALIVTPAVPAPIVSYTTSTHPAPAPTSTQPETPLIALAPRLSFPVVPPSILTRRASSVASVYRHARGVQPEDRTLGDDRLLGQAVALTSDGWFVTPLSVIGTFGAADLTVWMNGQAFPVQRGTIDHLNGTAYLKIDTSELSTPAFGDVSGLVTGAELWVERRSASFIPTLVTVLADRLPAPDPGSSETAIRRIRLHGAAEKGEMGAPAWDDRGTLLGIIESADGEALRLIPASSLTASFAQILNGNDIRHARLGVRGVDLTAWKFDGSRGDLPSRGLLLKDDRKSGKPAVAKDSPAAKAGLKAGDVILSVDRDILDGSVDLGEVLSEYRADTPVVIRILRDGKEQNLSVTLGNIVTSEAIK